jgi:hypothetical protein
MKLQYKIRSIWEELKLRVRVILAALRTALPEGMGGTGDVTPVGRLYATKVSNGKREDLGLICTKVVTDAGVQYLVDAFQGLGQLASNFKYHGSGTGTSAESAAQTALVTEVASRATGTQTEGASANIYRTVGSITYAGTFAIVEHGIFSAAAVGTMLDRSLFAAINVSSSDIIEFTYELTLPSGS